MTELVLLLIFQGAMILAASCDMFTMTIPNRLTAGFAVLFVFAALASGFEPTLAGLHLLTGAGALVAGFALFSFGWIGGGDAKFFAATALWIGPGLLAQYALAAAFFGGLLTLAIVLGRGWPLPAGLARMGWAVRLHDRESGIPYGIALALGGLSVAGSTPWALALFA